MFYVTGDTHGDFRRFAKKGAFRKKCAPGEKDYVIVCGDFGLLWSRSGTLDYNLEIMADYPFTLLWIQGNHENYDMIAEYPVEQWKGGKVRHILRDKVILLERGQIFHIDDTSFYTFGGASSHDIQGGVLDRDAPDYEEKKNHAHIFNLPYRVRNLSWWEAELPTDAELQEGIRNLEKADNQVDYILTHCPSGWGMRAVFRSMGLPPGSNYGFEEDVLTRFFDTLEEKVQFRHWFFGHMHEDLTIDEHHTLLYHGIVRLKKEDKFGYEIAFAGE
ncbi:MAG: metallophosphoesterase [Lachnospiraceae bacterium]|nr:metallophosphoesterase [Lachnospiraceae bacterium]